MFRIVGGDPEIFERRAKVQDSYQELRVHHPSLPPDLHPFQVMNVIVMAGHYVKFCVLSRGREEL